MSAHGVHAPAVAHEGEHAHPGAKTYVIIGAILTFITAVEVAIFYVPSLAGILVPSLLILSALKFGLVVAFYMHLKFDSKLFSSVFFAPMVLAVSVVIGLIIIFKVLPQYNW